MNIAEFIEQCRGQWAGFDDCERLALHEHPRDRNLSSLPKQIQGMATENKLMLLNLAAKNLAPGEAYVEIGCWHGLSLAGAALHNPNAPIYACDDFSQFNGTSAQLDTTIKQHTAPGQVQFYDMDFLSFLELAPWQPARIGVYFYDGGHTFADQYQALDIVLPWLADQALVIIDDTNAGQVRSANKLFVSQVPELRLLSDVRTPGNEFPTWWNGIQIYVYESRGRKITSSKHTMSHEVRRLFWDGFMPPTREVIQTGRRFASAIPGLKPLYKRMRGSRDKRPHQESL